MANIHEAARNGNLNEVKALLNQGVPVNSRDDYGRTPLHAAAYNGRLNVVQELLKRGARVNPRSVIGATPLHWATNKGHSRVVHALIKAGANPKYRNAAGQQYAYNEKTRNALRTSRAASKFQNYRKKSIARKRAPAKNVAEKAFSPARVRTMMKKYGNNWLNKV
jgi:ankyrin repeat protein